MSRTVPSTVCQLCAPFAHAYVTYSVVSSVNAARLSRLPSRCASPCSWRARTRPCTRLEARRASARAPRATYTSPLLPLVYVSGPIRDFLSVKKLVLQFNALRARGLARLSAARASGSARHEACPQRASIGCGSTVRTARAPTACARAPARGTPPADVSAADVSEGLRLRLRCAARARPLRSARRCAASRRCPRS